MTFWQIALAIFGMTCLLTSLIYYVAIISKCSVIERRIDYLQGSIEKLSRSR